jgi:hypothetical protein
MEYIVVILTKQSDYKKIKLRSSFQPGQTVIIAITPTLITTNAGAKRRFDPVRRQCYFEDEIELIHFPPVEGYRYG